MELTQLGPNPLYLGLDRVMRDGTLGDAGMGWGQGRGRCLRAPKETLSFLSKVLIPVGGGGGGQVDPCLPRGPREPPEGLGRGQGAGADRGAVRAQTWQEDEGKELLHCRGGARSQHGQGKGVLPALGPTWGWGLWGKEVGAEGAKGLSYLAGRGLRLSSPPGGMVGGGDLIHSVGGGEQRSKCSLGTSRAWRPRKRGETGKKREE